MKEKIHIGELIKTKLKEDCRSMTWLAKQVHCDSSSFFKLLKKNHIDTELLLRISLILNYDFFVHYTSLIREYKENAKDLRQNYP